MRNYGEEYSRSVWMTVMAEPQVCFRYLTAPHAMTQDFEGVFRKKSQSTYLCPILGGSLVHILNR